MDHVLSRTRRFTVRGNSGASTANTFSRGATARRRGARIGRRGIGLDGSSSSANWHRALKPRSRLGRGGHAELSSLILDFKDWVGFSVDARDDDLQMEILRLIPTQLTGLKMRLEEAETHPAKQRRRGRPTLIGRIGHVPPVLGLIADFGGTFAVGVLLGHLIGLW